uniref:hypothetical protein n=1 Tax=Nodularia sp. NIES-3585 TaxID=1973477 RepID=UPI0015954B90|nr:hypothetical protein [Nodularia sp. NIES-3585]
MTFSLVHLRGLLIREDLVSSLKNERILRDNKKLPANNQELFMNNLANLQAL